jgi:protein-disulfide isomerase
VVAAALGFGIVYYVRIQPDPPVPATDEYVIIPLRGDEPSIGSPEALITIVEFVDFSCSHCAEAAKPVRTLVDESDDVRLIFKHLPISKEFAAPVAAWSAHQQGRFWQLHDWLLERRGDTSRVLDEAAELSLDAAAFSEAMEDPRAMADIESDRQLAQRLSISGTPTFVVNGLEYRGALNSDQWEDIVASARAALSD